MSEQVWKRKEYESWDEAFRGLSPIIRQQSVRVAEYTRELFVVACNLRFGTWSKGGKLRILGMYSDLAYKCGLYHQLGKALVPPEYQILQKDFTEEEVGVYRKYTSDGRLLVALLQEKRSWVRGKLKGDLTFEPPTINIPNLMIRESCEQHMERFDGSGYPRGLKGDEISPIAQLVGLAKELDRLASETKAENPFDIAVDTVRAGVGKDWSESLIAVLNAALPQCRAVYNKYLAYTLTLPRTIPLVEKRPERKMGLKYRPMVSDMHGTVKMYEAIPWFGGIAEDPEMTESLGEVHDLLINTSLEESVSLYLLYEAADTMLRIRNCKLDISAIVLPMMPEFYRKKSRLPALVQLFIDQPIERDSLILTLPAELLKDASKTTLNRIQRYTRNGIRLLLDGYVPGEFDTELLKSLGLTLLRMPRELYLNRETANTMAAMKGEGFEFLGGDADSSDELSWLVVCGALCSSGQITGKTVEEDELILDSLARESSAG